VVLISDPSNKTPDGWERYKKLTAQRVKERENTEILFFLVVKGLAADTTDALQPCDLLCNPMIKMKMMIIFCPFPSNGAPVE
jgi:hypothetical protein